MQNQPPPYFQQGSQPMPVQQRGPPAYTGGGSQSGSPNQTVGSHPGSLPGQSSLGTPRVGWQPASIGDGRWRNQGQYQGQQGGQGQQQQQQQQQREVVLVPTRPLLKALAKECKPCPPWCVGHPIPENLSAELNVFSKFLQRSPQESERHTILMQTVQKVFNTVWADASLEFMGINACNVFPPETTLQVLANKTEEVPEDVETLLRQAANEQGFQISFFEDYRGVPTALLTEARTADKAAVRYGALVPKTKESSNIIAASMAACEASRQCLTALDSLLRQNKVLDESGSSPGIPSEALGVMLTCIVNSYDETDVPTAERLMVDFFLTFGFPAHFNNAELSVSHLGMNTPVNKVHANSQLSVLDPADQTINLTGRVDKVPHILAVFNYCYTAVAQFSQTVPNARRAQSALSTVIGGESYWSRVLALFHQQIEPFYTVVSERQHSLSQHR